MDGAYRNEEDGLRERAEGLQRELRETESRRAVLLDDLDQVKQQRDDARRRTLPLLDNVAIASPCNARWEDMAGDARVRFCGGCQKSVYNLSALTRESAEALLVEHEGQLCARLYRRTDGTVLTADCKVGVRRIRVRRGAKLAVGAGLLAALAALAAGRLGARHGLNPGVMGSVSPLPVVGESAPKTPPRSAINAPAVPSKK